MTHRLLRPRTHTPQRLSRRISPTQCSRRLASAPRRIATPTRAVPRTCSTGPLSALPLVCTRYGSPACIPPAHNVSVAPEQPLFPSRPSPISFLLQYNTCPQSAFSSCIRRCMPFLVVCGMSCCGLFPIHPLYPMVVGRVLPTVGDILVKTVYEIT